MPTEAPTMSRVSASSFMVRLADGDGVGPTFIICAAWTDQTIDRASKIKTYYNSGVGGISIDDLSNKWTLDNACSK